MNIPKQKISTAVVYACGKLRPDTLISFRLVPRLNSPAFNTQCAIKAEEWSLGTRLW